MQLSIITINLNNRAGLARTLSSVAAQSSQCFEYIVVDGGSTDGSQELLTEYAARIDRHVCEKDEGLFFAMNKGIAMSSGDYALFLNSGDTLFDAEVIERVLPMLDGQTDFLTGHIVLDNRRQKVIYAPKEVNVAHLSTGFLPHQATFIRLELLRRRPYQTQYRIVADWEQMYYELILHNASYQRLDVKIARFDMNGISAQSKRNGRLLAEMHRVLEDLLPPRIAHFLEGRDKLEHQILVALGKEQPLRRSKKLLRNAAKMGWRDIVAYFKA